MCFMLLMRTEIVIIIFNYELNKSPNSAFTRSHNELVNLFSSGACVFFGDH